jgi:hypothetical protein
VPGIFISSTYLDLQAHREGGTASCIGWGAPSRRWSTSSPATIGQPIATEPLSISSQPAILDQNPLADVTAYTVSARRSLHP